MARVLRENRLPPHCLVLELTESAVMADADAAVATLTALKALGIRLALDDFGTGYSSLSHLRQLPLDTVKIDRSFIQGIGHDATDAAIVQGVVALAKTLNLTVTAEGIEAPEQLSRLQALGCDLGQGYHLAHPLPADAVASLLATAHPANDDPAPAAADPAA